MEGKSIVDYQLIFTICNRHYATAFSNGMPAHQGESSEKLLNIILNLYKLCFKSVEDCNIFHDIGLTMILSFDDSREMSKVGSTLSEQIIKCRWHLRASIEIDNFDKLYITNYIEIYNFLLLFRYCKKEFTPFILNYKKYMEFVDSIFNNWVVLNQSLHNKPDIGDDNTKVIITFCALAKAYNKSQLKTRLKYLFRRFKNEDSKLLNFIHDALVNHPEVSDKFKMLLRQQRILECL